MCHLYYDFYWRTSDNRNYGNDDNFANFTFRKSVRILACSHNHKFSCRQLLFGWRSGTPKHFLMRAKSVAFVRAHKKPKCLFFTNPFGNMCSVKKAKNCIPDQEWCVKKIPRPKQAKILPLLASKEDIRRLDRACPLIQCFGRLLH